VFIPLVISVPGPAKPAFTKTLPLMTSVLAFNGMLPVIVPLMLHPPQRA
jgi:hypothetical protein